MGVYITLFANVHICMRIYIYILVSMSTVHSIFCIVIYFLLYAAPMGFCMLQVCDAEQESLAVADYSDFLGVSSV